jgi:hypothetical protein
MVHCLLIKMTNQIVSYSTCHKNHPNHIDESKSTYHIDRVVFLRLIILCIFLLKFWFKNTCFSHNEPTL